jgi:hypothetical protein
MIDPKDRMTLREGIAALLRGVNPIDIAVSLAAEAVHLAVDSKGSDLAIDPLFQLSYICTQIAIAENGWNRTK